MEADGWLFYALVFLTAAVVAAPVSRRLGFGSVLGYLVAGVIIGPDGLALIGDVEQVLHFSEFGVVLLLFLIGLDLEPRRLWALRRQLAGIGGIQVAASAAVIGLLAWWWLGSWQAALVSGLVLALSSTAIALQVLAERNLLATPAGHSGFAVLLFQDIAVIPMLALLPLLGPGSEGSAAIRPLEVARAVAAIALVVVVGRFALRRVLAFIAGTRQRELFTALSLFLVVAIAWLMDSVGLSMALGSFLAGVLLADSEYRHALESDLEPFKGLLMGLFFLAVGMSAELGVLATDGALVAAVALALVAVKTLVLLAVAPLAGVPRAQRLQFALVLSQGGEFAFVLFAAVAGTGVLEPAVVERLVLAVALSMMATPVLLFCHDRWIARRPGTIDARPMDVIDNEGNPVLIAGFGRFGQIVARLLHAHRIGTTIIDNNPDHIERVRRFGYKAYYGDARRLDLLETAGIGQARLLVLALDDRDATVDVARRVGERHPGLTVLARAYDRPHAFRLLDLGIGNFVRETFHSALEMGEQALQHLGFDEQSASRAAATMADHDHRMLFDMYAVRGDEDRMISVAQAARRALQRTLEGDREDRRFQSECERTAVAAGDGGDAVV